MQNGEKKKQTNKKSVGEVEKHKQRVLTQGVWEMGSESSWQKGWTLSWI